MANEANYNARGNNNVLEKDYSNRTLRKLYRSHCRTLANSRRDRRPPRRQHEQRGRAPQDQDCGQHLHLARAFREDLSISSKCRQRRAAQDCRQPNAIVSLLCACSASIKANLLLRALVGFLLSLTPLTNDLMNWRGAQTGNGSASIGAYFFFGGVLMILGAVGEVRPLL